MHCDLYGRKNPSPDNGIWIALGAAAVVFVGAGLLTARSALASPAPDPNRPVPVPPATPRPTPPHLPTMPPIVRQPTAFNPYSSAAIRVLQAQLHDLGYTVTHIDGNYGPETTRAVEAFLVDAGLDASSGGREIMIAVDTRYAYVFDRANA